MTFRSVPDYSLDNLRARLKALDEHDAETRRLIDDKAQHIPEGTWLAREVTRRGLQAHVNEAASNLLKAVR